MAKVEITINGKRYPVRQTMGALLRFKKETGRDVSEIKPDDVSDMCTLLWCCIVSACKHDGVGFDLSLMDFADGMAIEDVVAAAAALNAPANGSEEADGDEQKKSGTLPSA